MPLVLPHWVLSARQVHALMMPTQVDLETVTMFKRSPKYTDERVES